MDNKVTAMKPYGHIELRLKELMQLKNISRGSLARAINARYEVIDKWYHGRHGHGCFGKDLLRA